MAIDCYVIGDSIAVGISQARQECHAKAHIGWTSAHWNLTYLPQVASEHIRTLIISLGANDSAKVPTEAELRKLRSNVQADKVYWIGLALRRKPAQDKVIQRIAAEYGDVYIARPTTALSADRLHPTGIGYKALADKTR
jgi:lysophospholipase L1-like esterase